MLITRLFLKLRLGVSPHQATGQLIVKRSERRPSVALNPVPVCDALPFREALLNLLTRHLPGARTLLFFTNWCLSHSLKRESGQWRGERGLWSLPTAEGEHASPRASSSSVQCVKTWAP